VLIREITDRDWPVVWDIVRAVVRAGDTFTYDTDISGNVARDVWVEKSPGLTVVALDADGTIVGTAKMGPNKGGPGSHVSTASFMVADGQRGRGVGTALCRYALAWAQEQGYASMQFNAVVETNTGAVEIYRRLGFVIIGTVPRAFSHPVHGRVGLHIMYREFDGESGSGSAR
jgi:L-amino acid N-acyltransferase YncA